MRAGFALLAFGALAACDSPAIGDARAQALLALPAPQHYAERQVARELVGQCPAYAYDEQLGDALTDRRIRARQQVYAQVKGATDLEADVKRRSLAARYGSNDACRILDGETAAGTPLSVMVRKRG
ncbi:MAG: hypothetical protein KDK24_21460 [Pseudooceanicola sp.]|nr:hypothetical protein [Pseudooceanicola sp.]